MRDLTGGGLTAYGPELATLFNTLEAYYAQTATMNNILYYLQLVLLDGEDDSPAPPGSPPTRKS